MEKRIFISAILTLVGYLAINTLQAIPVEEPVVAVSEPTEEVVIEETISDQQEEPVQNIVENSEPVLDDCGRLRLEVEKYDWDVDVMMAIARAESNCREDAVGDTSITYMNNGREYGFSVGAFQIRIMEGREDCDSLDNSMNVWCAYNIYQGQGFKAWAVYNNGRYLDFL